MSKKAPPKEEEPDNDEIELVTVSRQSDLDNLIEDYKTEAAQRETTPKMVLYKFENDKTGKEREFIGYFVGEDIPEKHMIGCMFGGGRYQIYLKQPRGTAQENKQLSIQLKISHVYDAHKAKYDEEKRRQEVQRLNGISSPGPAQAITPAGGASIGESFVMLKELLTLIMPAIKAQSAAAATAQPAPDMLSQYAMMQKVLQKNLFDTAETYRAFNRRFQIDEQEPTGIEEEPVEPEKKEPSLMDQVGKFIKMVEPFFGLIAQKGSVAQITAQTVRAAPQFLEIISDPQLCRVIVNYFDRTKGKDASDQALKNLGINREKLFGSGTPGASGGPTASQTDHAAASKPGNGKVKPGAAVRVAARQKA